jgi:hypothetical protein
MDVLENAAKAGATRVRVSLWWEGEVFCFEVTDNGPGLPAAVAVDPTDPYQTTRTERPVGLGLALLRATAEQSGGCVQVFSEPGKGVCVTAAFPMCHVDAKPLGDLAGALLTSAVGWPTDLVLDVGRPAERILDLAEVRRELGEIALSHPDVMRFLAEVIAAGLAPLLRQAEAVFGRFGGAPLTVSRQELTPERPALSAAGPGARGGQKQAGSRASVHVRVTAEKRSRRREKS